MSSCEGEDCAYVRSRTERAGDVGLVGGIGGLVVGAALGALIGRRTHFEF